MNIQDINFLEILLGIVGVFFAYKQYKTNIVHHQERLYYDVQKQNKEQFRPYKELYYEEFLKVQKLLQNCPVLNDKIALLFHTYSQNKKDYLNHIYLDIQKSILTTLGDEIRWQNIENLNDKILSINTIGIFSSHMFNDTKENIMKLENSLDKNLYKELEISFIKVYNEFSFYFRSLENDLNIALERFSNILHKAKKEEVYFTNKLEEEYQQIVNLLQFMKSLTIDICVNEHGTIERLTRNIIVIGGVKLRIISELKGKVLN